MTHKPQALQFPIRVCRIDFILFGFIAIQLFWTAIIYFEVSDLRKLIQQIQMDIRP
jgi:hypothetical protein